MDNKKKLQASHEQGEQAPRPALPDDIKLRLQYFGYTAIPASILLDVMSSGQIAPSAAVGLIIGGTAGYFSPEIHRALGPGLRAVGSAIAYLNRNNSGRTRSKLLNKDWWLGLETTQYAEEDEDQSEQGQPEEENEPDDEPEVVDSTIVPEEDAALFVAASADETAGLARLTIEQIVRNTKPNSFKIWIGRSLTKEGNPAVQIKFYKQHFRFMGASQRGKSSMVAAFLQIVTDTHDPKHVRLILLDMENQTSNLFAHLPHVATIRRSGQQVKLHARTPDQVLEYLINTVEIMEYRYHELTKEQVLEQPIILTYIEEFLALKNEFKARIARAKTKGAQALAQAQSDYETLVYCIESLAQRGLKVRVQLLLCAQVEYRDDDFVEALVNVGCGFSFCVRPTAAAAAGFRNTELLKRNAKENKVGQAVVETPDCNDLLLAPEYDLEAKLLAFEKMQMRSPQEPTHLEDYARMRAQGIVNSSAQDEAEEVRAYERTNEMRQPENTTHLENDERASPDSPRLTGEQVAQFIGAYKVSGNKDKSLYACGANTRYRAHADEIIREHGLKKEGA